MSKFTFCTTVAGGKGQITEYRAGLIYQTDHGLYEVYINAQGKEFFFFNMRPTDSLPVDAKHVKDTNRLLREFNKFRNDFRIYTMTRDNNLWWKLKNKISPNPTYH